AFGRAEDVNQMEILFRQMQSEAISGLWYHVRFASPFA
ncbi:hypothetical protein Tco_1084524, partial [Tanacetum coccineum]